MKQLTLRSLPPDIEKKILEVAEKEGLSYNKAIISLLKKAAGEGRGKKKPVHHDLDHLCGIWDEEEAASFEKHLGIQRKIDESLWK
ncbi:MAG: hypothetical protein RDV48_06420 [Candidatus Eremiobacteraeota bacterium]|nr:hypothetical protein [Candidatus Eremiobacteraeota bacterium]